ncbi:MAG: isochorismatase family protein [Acidimicrobiales bacterium]|jgi:nicotinamidase-related amidase
MARPALEELVHPGRTALVLQELQRGVVGEESALPALADAAREVGVIPNASRLAAAARAAGVPVIHATAENLPGGFGVNRNARLFAGTRRAGGENAPHSSSVEPMPGLYEEGDLVLPRYHGLSPMTGGPLDSLLRNSGITTVVLAGVSLNVAIPNLVFDAVNRSYQVILVVDAVAGTPRDYGDQVIENCLRLLATVATTEEVTKAWSVSG